MTAFGIRAHVKAGLALAALLSAALGMAADVSPPAAGPSVASPGAPDPQHGQVLYLRHCAVCHRGHGWGDGPREIPALAGQREAYLIEQLTRFASGERAGSAMHGPAMHDTLKATDVNRAPAIRDLAAYLARAPVAPQAEQGEGRALARAKSAYLGSCAGCHGEDGIGPDGGSVPRIGGQHFRYVLSRLRDFGPAHGGRVAAPALSADEQQALADFISRLPAGGSTPQAPRS
jgi:cytochrome c553